MTDPSPPANLPRAYHPIWRALAEAGRRLGSRRALANELRVSTHTLQRILVSGEVPSFPATTSKRIAHAWIRTLTRLASRLGYEPRGWIELVGIPWNDVTRRVSESALRGLTGETETAKRQPLRPSSESLSRSHTARSWLSRLQVGYVDCPPHAAHLPGFRSPFLEVLARRLIGAIDPSCTVHTTPLPEGELITKLVGGRASLDLGAGVLETVARRRRGLVFAQVPGLRVRLTAMLIRKRDETRRGPSWQQLISIDSLPDHYLLVLSRSVCHDYLLGQCRYPPQHLLVRTTANTDELAQVFFQETQRHPERWIVLACREDLGRVVAATLEREEGFADDFTVCEVEGAPDECPSFPVGIAVGPSASEWLYLLEAARDEELFTNDYRQTARLYGELLAIQVLQAAHVDVEQPDAAQLLPKPTHFARATVEFQEELCRHLLATLEAEITKRLEARGQIRDAQALCARATGLAALYTQRAIPEVWGATLATMLGQVPVPPEAPERAAPVRRWKPTPLLRCQSCSVSLLDEDHRGVSDRYCRFCADEHGRLKPKNEVRSLIARWFQYWQVDLSDDEATRRADLYMQALPAWSGN
jgi:hypothetical protein